MKELIEKVISNFDFEKVHKAMIATNWWWGDTNFEVPSIAKLVVCAAHLLKEVSEMETGHSIGTGGFTATKLYNNEYGEGLSLTFTMTESESYKNDE